MVVRGVTRFSLDLQDAFTAGPRLTDIRAMPRMGRGVGKSDFRRHAGTPYTDAKGQAGRAGIRTGVPAAASVSVRTMMRFASSILNRLSPEGFASVSAASPARRKLAVSALEPSRIFSAAWARQGLAATPPSASRASRILPASIRRQAAAETTAKA